VLIAKYLEASSSNVKFVYLLNAIKEKNESAEVLNNLK
jgi:hypothetical protein